MDYLVFVSAITDRGQIKTLEKVVSDKRLWIYSKLLKKESLNTPTAVKEYVSVEGFYYLGCSYRLKLMDGVKGQPPLRFYQSRFELQRDVQAAWQRYWRSMIFLKNILLESQKGIRFVDKATRL